MLGGVTQRLGSGLAQVTTACANPVCNSRKVRVQCSTCQAQYCGHACQKEHWSNGHEEECSADLKRYKKPASPEFEKKLDVLSEVFFDLLTTRNIWRKFISEQVSQAEQNQWEHVSVNFSFESLGDFQKQTLELHAGTRASLNLLVSECSEKSHGSKKSLRQLLHLARCHPDAVIVSVLIGKPSTEDFGLRIMLLDPKSSSEEKAMVLLTPHDSGKIAREEFRAEVAKAVRRAGSRLKDLPEFDIQLNTFVERGIAINVELNLPRCAVKVVAPSDEPAQIPTATIQDEVMWQRVQDVTRRIIFSAAKEHGADIKEIGRAHAKEYGRGAFTVRFRCLEDADALRPQSINDYALQLVEQAKQAGVHDKSVRARIMEVIAPCPAGVIGDCVAYRLTAHLQMQFDDKNHPSLRYLQTYDISTSVMLCAEIAMSGDDVLTLATPYIYDFDKPQARRWKHALRHSEVELAPQIDTSFDNPVFHPLCRETVDILAARTLVERKQKAAMEVQNFVDLEQNLYALLAVFVNTYLQKNAAEGEQQRKHREILALRCPTSLLDSGLGSDMDVMQILAGIWNLWGGREEYFAALQVHYSQLAGSKSSLISMDVMQVCSTCHKAGHFQKCVACKSVAYCSKECQKKGWKVHKVDCTRIRIRKEQT